MGCWFSAPGCELQVATSSFYRFDETQSIFYGKVVGYVISEEPIASTGKGPNRLVATGPTAGLVVDVKGSLFTPDPVKKTYEVYRFNVAPDCSLIGQSVELLNSKYPIGEMVQVIAGPADHLPQSSQPDVGRLEIRHAHRDSICDIEDSDRTVRNSIDDPGFDYRRHRADLLGDISFEFKKDLLRLKRAKTSDERETIIDRLTYYPQLSWLRLTFREYSQSPEEFARWAELALNRALSSEAYQRYSDALAEKNRKLQ